MSTWTKAVLTTAGLALQAKLVAGTTLAITKAVAGTGTVDESALASQTDVTSPISATLSLQGRTIDEETAKCKLPVILTNENVSAACVVKQIGVYANDPDNGEILFFIAQDTTGLDVPSKTESPGYSARWNFNVSYGQADNVTVTVDPSAAVSQSDMEAYVSSAISVKADLSSLNSHINDESNPHNVTKSQVGLGNVDNTSDADKPISTATQTALNGKAASDFSNVSNDSFQLKAISCGVGDIIVSATSTDGAAYTATADGITELKRGMSITIIPDKTSSAVIPTINLNGLGAKNIKQRLSINTSLTVEAANATWMVANKPVPLIFDGTQFVTVTPRSSADDIYGEVDIEHGGTGATTAEQALENLGAAAKDLSNVELSVRFENATLPVSASWYSVTYGNGKFVAVAEGNSIAAYSKDGINWTQATMPTSASWHSVTYGNGKFVAVAGGGTVSAYSTDGINWIQATMPVSDDWISVTYGNGKFVAVAEGNSIAAYSEDGINWTQATMPASHYCLSVTYGNGKFVTVSRSRGYAAYSEDGINWTHTTMPTSASWQSVTYGNGKFVAVTSGNSIAAYSEDGISWTQTTMPAYAYWESVTYGNDKFVAVDALNSNVAYSTDGINWTQTNLPASIEWVSVTYGNGKFVAVAYDSKKAAYSTIPTFIESLTDFGYAKVEVGSYVGTGTYGDSNPTTIDIGDDAKIFMLLNYMEVGTSYTYIFGCKFGNDIDIIDLSCIAGSSYKIIGSNQYARAKFENGILYAYGNTANYQANMSGYTYLYAVIK